MATTCKDIIEAAYARSSFNDPDKLATNAELIGVIDRRMKQLYSIVADHNPLYFGATQTVVGSSGTWARPADAELVFRIETQAGEEVHIVPFEDRSAEMPPRVYEFGQKYYSVGQSGDPQPTDQLKFYYSKRHPSLDPTKPPSDAANTLDATWPEQFNDLVVLHVAKYLATKDGRPEEVALLTQEEQLLMAVFIDHLRHENYGVKTRWKRKVPADAKLNVSVKEQ